MDDIENHPDLTDQKWLRGAERRARRAARRARRRPGPRWSRLVIPGVLVLFCGALIVFYRVGTVQLPESAPTTGAAPTSAHPDPTSAEATGHVDLTRPFATTPAADWPTEVPVPIAKATGRFSAAQVDAAYRAVQKTTTEARLDPEVTVRHDNGPYLATLTPGVKLPDPGSRITKIADGYQLLPVPPRVSGGMTSSVDEHGDLVVHANFVYAYAFQPPAHLAPSTPWDIVSVIHENADYAIVDGKPWPSTEKSYFYSINCDLTLQQGLLAPQYSGRGGAAPDAEPPQAYYDPKHTVDIPKVGC
ncbi:hypothetical protein [Kutzneria sp. CA-103260]|uniref:hypothetical protein n=1 Tax=Kutzneria sp. CA-103260 TaxID=2802641 RepID=UPI001BA9F3C8|nr:hypothetical protein [Kutzneria sp. CA-103260]QUQ68090.1 hypothetical protein JJ691_58300 [Kutzneria sp. CA-103260]